MDRLLPLLLCCALLSGAGPLCANGEGSGSGTVAETLLVESYVYVRLEEDGTWLAAAPTPVAVGDKVEYAAGIQMGQFHSKSLDRTFDSIVFVGSLKVASRLADGHALAGDPHAVRNSATAPPPAAGEIPPLEGGRTIGEIHAASAELDDQEVALRARVVKVSEGILGRNWITLQDGTGQAPADKLIATSDHLAEVGEIVAVSGTLRSDVDLGSGYRYGVLLEEATFSR